MPIDFNNPTNTQAYTQLLESIRELFGATASMNYDGGLNVPVGTISYNLASKRFKLLQVGGSTVNLPLEADQMPANSITSDQLQTVPVPKGGTGATTVAGARANLGLGTSAVMNASSSVTSGSSLTTADSAGLKLAYDRATEALTAVSTVGNDYAPISHSHPYQQISELGSSAILNASGSTTTNSNALVATSKAVYDAKNQALAAIPKQATNAQVAAGTDDTAFVTPADLKSRVDVATAPVAGSPLEFTSAGVTTWISNCSLVLIVCVGGGGGGGAEVNYTSSAAIGGTGGTSLVSGIISSNGGGGGYYGGSGTNAGIGKPGPSGGYVSDSNPGVNGSNTINGAATSNGAQVFSASTTVGHGGKGAGRGGGGASGSFGTVILPLVKGQGLTITVGAGGRAGTGLLNGDPGTPGAIKIIPLM